MPESLTADHSAVSVDGLPPQVAAVLSDFIAEAENAFADDLVAAVLFGSAADGTFSATSDVNLVLVLRSFDPSKIAAIRDTFLTAEAAIKLRVMFLLESELTAAVELFAQKFADIMRRRRVIYGRDVFSGVTVPRDAEKFRLRQILLNLTLRLRESYALSGQRSEQMNRMLADVLGPVRAAAATLLELEGAQETDANTALRSVAASLGSGCSEAAATLFAAHDGRLAGADAQNALLLVIDLLKRMSERAARIL